MMQEHKLKRLWHKPEILIAFIPISRHPMSIRTMPFLPAPSLFSRTNLGTTKFIIIAPNRHCETNLTPTISKAHLMAGEVRHHRADVMGVTETKRCINRVFEIECADTRMGIQGVYPLVRGIVKGFRTKNP